MNVLSIDSNEFLMMVRKPFAFLERKFGFSLKGVNTFETDPRDAYISTRYTANAQRVDIAWAPISMSLGILVRIEKKGLSRREQHMYAEPFIAFATDGKVAPIVPQVYPAMSVSRIQSTMDARAKVFANGLGGVLEALAERFNAYYPQIRDASLDTIRAYHSWYQVVIGT